MNFTQKSSSNELIEPYYLMAWSTRRVRFCCGNNNSHHLLCTYYVPTISYVKNEGKKMKELR